MSRSILITTLIAAAIGLPWYLGNLDSKSNSDLANSGPGQPSTWSHSSFPNDGRPASPFRTAGNTTSIPTTPNAVPLSSWNGQTAIPSNPANLPTSSYGPPAMQASFGAGTVILPGDENGPDFSAMPMEFLPVSNLGEVFRFSVTPAWVQGRWQRISTSPSESGLYGLRVALVTGTNSWDLHGSLTYYFDSQQKCQRIAFRGWCGDPGQLIRLLEQAHGFQSQPTPGAGLFLAGSPKRPTSGMIMKHPPVVYTENRVQRIALVLEINGPQSKSGLSNEFRSMLAGNAMPQ